MAVLIKKPVINEARAVVPPEKLEEQLLASENIEFNADRTEVAQERAAERVEEITVDSQDEAEQEEHKPDVTFVENKLLCDGLFYIPESELEEYIQHEIQVKTEKLQEETAKIQEQGYDEGYSAGEAKARQEYEKKLTDVTDYFAKIHELYSTLISESEDQIKEIIFSAICKSFGELLQRSEERMAVIENILANIKNAQLCKIKVSRADFESLFKDPNQEYTQKYNIEADGRVELGGCIIETDKGIFDGRLEIQLARLKDAIEANYS